MVVGLPQQRKDGSTIEGDRHHEVEEKKINKANNAKIKNNNFVSQM